MAAVKCPKMSQNVPASGSAQRPFRWTGPKHVAARLVAEDSLSDERIAAKAGIDRRQLTRWKAHPGFAAEVAGIVKELAERSLRHAIARRHRRVAALDDRWHRLRGIIDQRAADPEMAHVPGGTTGLLVVKSRKTVGEGENARTFLRFALDVRLMRELRELEKRAAKEVGD